MGIIDAGNAGMASGGMGDVLSGIIGALLGQKLPFMMQPVRAVWPTAQRLTSLLHAMVRAVCWPPIFCTLRRVVNPDVIDVEND